EGIMPRSGTLTASVLHGVEACLRTHILESLGLFGLRTLRTMGRGVEIDKWEGLLSGHQCCAKEIAASGEEGTLHRRNTTNQSLCDCSKGFTALRSVIDG